VRVLKVKEPAPSILNIPKVLAKTSSVNKRLSNTVLKNSILKLLSYSLPVFL
jgi:hypothetical protein